MQNKEFLLIDSSLLPKDNFLNTDNGMGISRYISINNKDIKSLVSTIYLLLVRYMNYYFFPIIIKKNDGLWIFKISADKNITFCDLQEKIENGDFEPLTVKEDNIPIIFDMTGYTNTYKQINEMKFIFSENKCEIIFNEKNYSQVTLSRFVDNLLYLKQQIINNSNQSISFYDIVCLKEKMELNKFNFKNSNYYVENESLISKFNEIVINNKTEIAAIYGDKKITYEELNNYANYYAKILLQYDSKYIGLSMEDDLCTYIGILAILKAGKCIVTINPSYPIERVKMITQQLDIDAILICPNQTNKFSELESKYVICRYDFPISEKIPNISIRVNPNDECYIIYTSGTTGNPKGVIITHKNILIEINYLEERCKFINNSKSLHILNYSFDFGLYDILANLVHGRCLCSLDKKRIKNFKNYIEFINELQIENINTTPTFFNILSSFNTKLSSLKYVHLGGEKVTYEMVKKYDLILSEECDLYNGYGPCETTVGNALHLVTLNERKGIDIKLNSVPIGDPTDSSELYVLDANENYMPINAIGELCISGECIGKGYIDSSKNAGKFVNIKTIGNKFAYKTGDYVRWLSNGELEFVIRIDNQIKKNGFRIELSEINDTILKIQYVVDVVTIFLDKRIISFIVSNKNLSKDYIYKHIKQTLPMYMLPSDIYFVKKLPTLKSGKVDINYLKVNIKNISNQK